MSGLTGEDMESGMSFQLGGGASVETLSQPEGEAQPKSPPDQPPGMHQVSGQSGSDSWGGYDSNYFDQWASQHSGCQHDDWAPSGPQFWGGQYSLDLDADSDDESDEPNLTDKPDKTSEGECVNHCVPAQSQGDLSINLAQQKGRNCQCSLLPQNAIVPGDQGTSVCPS